jgi:hypothetical protein
MSFLITTVPKILEKYGTCAIDLEHPHISKYMCNFWGSSYFHEYVNQLITHQRPERQGFSIRVMRELYLAIEAHNEQYPLLTPIEKFNWY